MRKNLPVSDAEYLLRDGLAIVSKTDIKGKITYINPYFIEVSGFTEDELLGAPHNLVRHPDMPPEAFADLWETLKAGIPWTGLVKNRRKNGDFYWVQANVTPVHEDGRIVGYMSVRTKPSRQQVEAATALYEKMRSGQAKNMALRHGVLVRTGLAGRIDRLKHLPMGISLGLKMSAMCLLLLVMGILGFKGALPQSASLAWTVAALSGAGTLLSLYIWHALHAAIVQPVREATKTARTIAGGDLSAGFNAARRGEIGQLLGALEQMNVNLLAIIGDVRANIESITSGTEGIMAGNIGLSSRTKAQATSLKETTANIGQLVSAVKQNAEHALHANKLGLSAAEVAVKGGEVVEQVASTMADISTSSRKIVDIVGLIDGIAFQTNMLALNAAVEAARAGEQGRGFAVVAADVRNLAQRCAGAAKEIKALIDTAAQSVKAGNVFVAQAGTTMSEILDSVKRVSSLMGDISAASEEQDAGIEQIDRAIMQMNEATRKNSALVEQATGAAASLADQAQRLSQAISVFRLERNRPALARLAPVPVARIAAAPRAGRHQAKHATTT
ncbi:PAS domain-containing methyl-accepting chemotaxis protein [Noviherbaspirillum sp.]|jgi:aerotaxis receptor|uniref:methyl-accepting chemotaxis protein n=1 Tax=Noviherbaspirillum sp. TaxID=1926288 RepID=UPI0025FC4F4B|nr:PAS domain-containing methyl-accepting chemotaxis protein [Noviherbaspirillum sp.]HJV52390.1 methyl-accepting chemotaxis protein [Noviherbaspirillum sp.]